MTQNRLKKIKIRLNLKAFEIRQKQKYWTHFSPKRKKKLFCQILNNKFPWNRSKFMFHFKWIIRQIKWWNYFGKKNTEVMKPLSIQIKQNTFLNKNNNILFKFANFCEIRWSHMFNQIKTKSKRFSFDFFMWLNDDDSFMLMLMIFFILFIVWLH